MKPESSAAATIDEYISEFSPDVQRMLSAMRSTIRKAAPDATEKIAYRIPTFDYHGNLVHFAAFKNHVGFYPGARGISAFQKQLEGYKSSKGAVQFPLDEPLPLELVARIVKFRVGENAAVKRKPKRGVAR